MVNRVCSCSGLQGSMSPRTYPSYKHHAQHHSSGLYLKGLAPTCPQCLESCPIRWKGAAGGRKGNGKVNAWWGEGEEEGADAKATVRAKGGCIMFNGWMLKVVHGSLAGMGTWMGKAGGWQINGEGGWVLKKYVGHASGYGGLGGWMHRD
jgi:hypothetical protein